jgi:hypothetical protein
MAKNDTLIIFGNGLGMAIDPNRFAISEGLRFAWGKLDEKEQLLLSTLKGISKDKPPQSEKELKSVEEVRLLNVILESIADDPDAWLSSNLKTVPRTVSNFRKHVADYFIEKVVRPWMVELANYGRTLVIICWSSFRVKSHMLRH